MTTTRNDTAEHEPMFARRNRLAQVLGIMMLVALAAAVVWRIHVGVGTWGDEPYQLSTALRYHLGDKPLVDSWDTNFSSSLLVLPFLKAYVGSTGTTDGIMLAYRWLQLAVTSLTGLMAYVALRRWAPAPVPAAMGALILAYMPFLSPQVGYGMDAHWHMLSAFLALLLYRTTRPTWLFGLVGLVSMLGVIANPPTVLVLPFFVAALVVAHRDAGSLKKRLEPALWYAGGFALAGLVFAVGLDAVARHREFSLLRYVLRPDDHDFSLLAYVHRFLTSKWVGALPVLLGGLFAVLARGSADRSRLIPAAVLAAVAATYVLVLTGRLTVSVVPQSLAFIVGATLLVAFWRADAAHPALLLALPALGAGAGWFLGSNAGLHTALLAAPLVLAAALLSWPARTAPRLLGALALSALVMGVAAPGLALTPEGKTWEMVTPVRTGPFEGMLATPAEAALQDELIGALRSLPPIEGRILFLERFPLGYLAVMQRPGTYSTWATSSTSERLQRFVDVTGDRPVRVVLTRYAFDVQDGEFPSEVHLEGFETRYEKVYEDENYRVYDLR